ncbi:phosphatase PAP2 family protein [Paramaledivibacter caminithermalis]|jgi:membrane-associated phospholipid phosphatase|uniref:PAP2 superfamily protein n=1 Tax=Paramaledivibacter caminithermalis (strain DSM 15212 / CIP 107654 / DViRD3) TaxID=1121301 RepID=A0A1M6PBT1_PARC5|nr:phosphatase PAP2 family protein [Paramaledivibacter caminithermalis]SHK05403.1 hypothetical protein SAMN02745912_02087 [Paramaledivibacter caminithermalis DSM 15212]
MILIKLKEHRHFAVLLYYLVIYCLYIYTEKVTVPQYIMYSKLDDYIPFVKEMVIPYLFWYIYIFIALMYLGFTSKKDFYKLCGFMFVGMTICFIIYLLFPNGQNLRPLVLGDDLLSYVIRYIYYTDTPTNSAPSMHVLDSIAVHLTITNCDKLKNNRMLRLTSGISMLSIIASTVMIKQHSIIDVLYGIILSLIIYWGIYKVNIYKYLSSKKFIYVNDVNR